MSATARVAFATTIFFVVFVAVLQSGLLSSEAEETVTDVTFIALGLVYVPLAVRTASAAQGRLKSAWVALAIGFTCWLIGELLWSYYRLVAEQTASPSWSDAAYLAYYPFVCSALLLFPTARSWRSQAQLILDAVIVTGSFFLISWLTVLRPVWQEGPGNKLEFIVALAYPAGDVLVMTIGMLVLIRAAPGLRLALSLLVAGLMAAAVADSLWVYESQTTGYSAGSLIDLLYAANALLIIVAIVAGYRARPGDPAGSAPPGWLSRSLPLLPLVVAAAVVALAQPAVVREGPVLLTGAVLIVSLVLRQILEGAELAKRERQISTMADRLSGELTSAAKYVRDILPGDLAGPVQVRSRYLPAREPGGDSFGYLWVDNDHLVVYLIDVSGHGVQPALLSVSVHNMLRSRSMPVETLLSPERVMDDLNRRFGMDRHDGHYIAMWYGVYQKSNRRLRYVAAGHPPAVALTESQSGISATLLGGDAIPVGVFADASFSECSYPVPAGSQLLLCSDGVLGDRLSFSGFAELCEEVAAAPGWSPSSLIARIRATAGGTFDDDCAVVQMTFTS